MKVGNFENLLVLVTKNDGIAVHPRQAIVVIVDYCNHELNEKFNVFSRGDTGSILLFLFKCVVKAISLSIIAAHLLISKSCSVSILAQELTK